MENNSGDSDQILLNDKVLIMSCAPGAKSAMHDCLVCTVRLFQLLALHEILDSDCYHTWAGEGDVGVYQCSSDDGIRHDVTLFCEYPRLLT